MKKITYAEDRRRPTGPGGSTGPNDPNGSNDQNDPTDSPTDGNGYTEDVSSTSAAYADNELIWIGSVSYVNIIMIIPAVAVLAFILKRKYSGRKDRH